MRYIFTAQSVARIIEGRPGVEKTALYHRAMVCKKTRALVEAHIDNSQVCKDAPEEYKQWTEVKLHPYLCFARESLPIIIRLIFGRKKSQNKSGLLP